MKSTKLVSRYAQALYDFSVETDKIETVYHDVLFAQKIISSHQELKAVLESPCVTQEKKQKILSAVFNNNLSEITLRFFSLLAKKRRLPQLLLICAQYMKIYYKNHNIKEVYITTAFPIPEETQQYLQSFLCRNSPYTYIFHLSVNPAIIGGIVVKIDDLCFDAGIRAKINKLKIEFSKNNYAAGF